ncbi:ABC-type transport system, involved in lipoprotein release, permease component [bacterium A37T11]|nr:ABC-type transport system, involved in lipoprotein release, permease component [bacterium A37T11]
MTHYVKIAWRNLSRKKGFTALNIVGLSVGMAAAILIALWIQSEYSYDRMYPTTDRLYQIYSRATFNGKPSAYANTPGPLVPALKSDYPEFEDAVRLASDEGLLSAGEKHLKAAGAIVDPGFLSVFGFPMKDGDARSALLNNSGIVLGETLAKKLFNDESAVGKSVQINNKEQRLVTAVLKNIPQNSRFNDIDYFLPYAILKQRNQDMDKSWTANNFRSYALLKEGTDPITFNQKIRDIIVRHTREAGQPVFTEVLLHPAAKWRLYSRSDNGQLVEGKISDVRRMERIAIFILLIACINFMNLSTAHSEKRAKEVGIRKVAGARRFALVFQFISESVLLAFLSAVVAIILVWISLPAFNGLVGKELTLTWADPFLWLAFLVFILFTGLLAGSYPAFFLSAFKPVTVLKGGLLRIRSGFTSRKVLVVLQFSFAILLIICTLVIKRQIDYGKSRETGYNKHNLVYTAMEGDLLRNYELVKQDLLSSGAVIAVNKSMGPISRQGSNGWGFSWPGSGESAYETVFDWMSSDGDFIKTMGVKLLAGRDIDVQKYQTDSTAVLINEAAQKVMKLKDPVGATVKTGDGVQMNIVGVIQDFILGSPYDPIEPMLVMGPASWFNYINYRLNPQHPVADNLKAIAGIFKKYNPMYPFEYMFTDTEYQEKFESEERFSQLSALFMGLTILIACLGLFGLAAFTAEQRRKEIGVRKVLGATVQGLAVLLSKDFVKLVVIAFIVASPIAYWMMSDWLKDFNYRISISWTVFVITGILAILIAVATVSFQAIRAAVANPVDSLRDE